MSTRADPIIECSSCGSLLGTDFPDAWLEHHEDGSHTLHYGGVEQKMPLPRSPRIGSEEER